MLVSRLPVDISKKNDEFEIREEMQRQVEDLHGYDEEAKNLSDKMFTMHVEDDAEQS